MTDDADPAAPEPGEGEIHALAAALEARCPFGPAFFLTQLRAFVRDRCPAVGELPVEVRLHLVGGEVLDLCHVVGLAPAWVALAVFVESGRTGARSMRTELLPYGMIVRVSILPSRGGDGEGRIGFDAGHVPAVFAASGDLSPAGTLRVVAEGRAM